MSGRLLTDALWDGQLWHLDRAAIKYNDVVKALERILNGLEGSSPCQVLMRTEEGMGTLEPVADQCKDELVYACVCVDEGLECSLDACPEGGRDGLLVLRAMRHHESVE